jgi:5-methylcytosine-specific restriction enzyme A
MSDWYEVVDKAHIQKERRKAQELKRSSWWKTRLSAGLCGHCGKKFKASELTMDHLVPLARGGKTTKGNVVPSCRPCNQAKKLITPVESLLESLDSGEDR